MTISPCSTPESVPKPFEQVDRESERPDLCLILFRRRDSVLRLIHTGVLKFRGRGWQDTVFSTEVVEEPVTVRVVETDRKVCTVALELFRQGRPIRVLLFLSEMYTTFFRHWY